MKYKYVLVSVLSILIGIHPSVRAQVSISGVINRYFKVTAFTPASGGTCTTPATKASVTIGAAYGATAPAALVAGMEVLIIQMKAGTTAVINRSTGATTYGNVTNLGGAGNYEFATISTVVGSTVTFTSTLANIYDPAGQVQLIPTWLGNTASTTYTSAATLQPLAYDELLGVGGVLTLSTSSTLTLNHDINASAMGFQGGDTIGDPYKATWPPNHIRYACCGSKVVGGGTAMDATNAGTYAFPLVFSELRYDDGSLPCGNAAIRIIKGARKGHGVFGVFAGEELSKGKVANGGGGGHGFNTGGGGGGGYDGGGNGGYELAWSCNDGTTGTQPAGVDHGGRGGLGLKGGTYALFMGGGGGGGHGDGNTQVLPTLTTGGYPAGDFRGPTSGGDGGGIVIVKASQIIASGARTIFASGGIGGFSSQDGAGGGGGGGSIVLEVPTYSGLLTLDASGGTGGNAINPNSFDCHGPGGGGGGGRVVLSTVTAPAGITINTNAGAAGRLLQMLNSGGNYLADKTTNFCGSNINYGAGVGASVSATTLNTVINTTPCTTPLKIISFKAELYENTKILVSWNMTLANDVGHFVLERGVDGFNFIEITTKQKTQSSGYTYIDNTSHTSSGTLYYRLKLISESGSISYSNIAGLVLKGTLIDIYPSPAQAHTGLFVKYASEIMGAQIPFSLLDVHGKVLVTNIMDVSEGEDEYLLSLNDIAAGLYFVRIDDPYGQTVKKVVVE